MSNVKKHIDGDRATNRKQDLLCNNLFEVQTCIELIGIGDRHIAKDDHSFGEKPEHLSLIFTDIATAEMQSFKVQKHRKSATKCESSCLHNLSTQSSMKSSCLIVSYLCLT